MLTLNIIAIICLVLSYAGGYVKPSSFWPLSFFALAFPLIFVVNLIFPLYWAFRWRRLFWLPMIFLLPGLIYVPRFIQWNPVDQSEKEGFKIMTYNVRLFDLYNWTENKKTKNKIFDFLQDQDADILCFQEFYQDDSGDFKTLDTLVKFQKAKYVHIDYTKTLRNIHHWGIATFSKFPIVFKGRILFGKNNNNSCIYSDIDIGNDTIRVYNVHLQSAHLNPKDLKMIEDLDKKNKEANKDIIQGYRKIFEKLKRASIRRTNQVDTIVSHIKSSPYPVIVCGDFNDTPASYVYNRMRETLKDGFMETGNGLGRTYNGKFPSMRIDYIFYSPDFKSREFETNPEDFSDHFPLTMWIRQKDSIEVQKADH